ncbi:MAG: hypothetical protein ACFE9I_13110 [Candidatus Hermodarchaeota archaeon]
MPFCSNCGKEIYEEDQKQYSGFCQSCSQLTHQVKMLVCINCGAEISEHQQEMFLGLCPPCVRLEKKRRRGVRKSRCINPYGF